ncbi:hypothetical protein STCU_01133 [Strigomonas culicis]|uniref:DUF1861 family protein n=1 Tax=Strigomonas culicis TaxID=28005 RepID=S9UDN7_9TRYP|nr:hypothetical protein STCU_05341 [Strigomonas culicis]EPY28805.1 hypothetical protein STCU_04872 [Strigomonas culicis]EPY28932.1 hypothetical protein STCU_04809 [Strigomonas culicis]EPY35541.1 hypothetical protein STCU_01133 [Strigomonas culicis]|eukprot:EPY28020.1 hypothetical protein STCU_05341 [Strigomonas culicis]
MKAQRVIFEREKRIYDKALLKFKGVDGFDVYNCSVPFMYKGKRHIYGRVEKRSEWANSHVRLFVETGKDEYSVLLHYRSFELEDPYIANIKGEMIFGGTHVRKDKGGMSSYFGYFYRGTPAHLTYFTTGPNYMKDIRLVDLPDGRIGVFSRPRLGTRASIGWTIINTIEELGEDVISKAKPLDILGNDMWGGVNQAYLLTSGKVGCIAHYSYEDKVLNIEADQTVYLNYAFVLDPITRTIEGGKIIGTQGCYPPCPAKINSLHDCAFTSGITMRSDGKCDLYSGVGDTHEGRITIDYPFEGYGQIIDNLTFHDNAPIKSSL